MAAAAEAMRTRRNILVYSFFERGRPRTPAHRAEPRVCPKPRARELRALDLDQTSRFHLRWISYVCSTLILTGGKFSSRFAANALSPGVTPTLGLKAGI